jgi:hypothetical protein
MSTNFIKKLGLVGNIDVEEYVFWPKVFGNATQCSLREFNESFVTLPESARTNCDFAE